MPTRHLNPIQENLQTLTKWLDENLNDEKRIKACCKEVNKLPIVKGIYFWLMHQSSYKKLNGLKSLKPVYQRNINGEVYHLVYTGTAGVRNNSNGKNDGNLKKRIKWHLCENKTVAALCSGTMSTFRRTIGSLLEDDLIENDIQVKIDGFFCDDFYIYYLEYPGTFLQVKDIVNSEETVIINLLRPIFNLDENPNVSIPGHVTNEIQKRRQKVEKDSKLKWCYEKNPIANSKRKKILSSKKLNVSVRVDFVDAKNGCVEFKVNINDSVHQVIQNIPNLPNPCIFLCYNSNNSNQLVYQSNRKNGWRSTGLKGGQNVYTYFSNSDKLYSEANKFFPKINRSEIIQLEMKRKKIKEITVRVCPINQNKTK